MEWSTDAFIANVKAESSRRREQKLGARSQAHMREHTLTALQQALGEMPKQVNELQVQLLERKEYDSYVMERIAYSTMEHAVVPVLVLIPKHTKAPWPAVIACHGHGEGQFEALGMTQDGHKRESVGIHNEFAVKLVSQGLLVVIPEIMGFGVRRIKKDMQDNRHYTSCAALAAQLLMCGRTLAGMRVYETMRAIDYVQSRSDVLPADIGIFGFSGGALIAAYTAALDSRVAATVLTGWVNTFEASILGMAHCIDNYLPSLYLEVDQQHIVAALAPRPLFIEAGERDHIFPIHAAKKAIEYVQQAYMREGAGHKLHYYIHDGGHEISGEGSVRWLREQLSNSC